MRRWQWAWLAILLLLFIAGRDSSFRGYFIGMLAVSIWSWWRAGSVLISLQHRPPRRWQSVLMWGVLAVILAGWAIAAWYRQPVGYLGSLVSLLVAYGCILSLSGAWTPIEICQRGVLDTTYWFSWADMRGWGWDERYSQQLWIRYVTLLGFSGKLRVNVSDEQREAVEQLLREHVPAAEQTAAA